MEANLAHSWRRLDTLRWRFYLRPAVLWHDGRELTSEEVAASLTRSAGLPLFSHLHAVQATGPLSIEITLTHADDRLPLLLSHIDAMILPAGHAQRDSFASRPIGTGPYRVAENNDWHLRMQAFDHYFGLRGLLDEVEVFIWPDLTASANEPSSTDYTAATWLSSSLSDEDYASGLARQLTGKPSDRVREMFLERGGYFLLCDSRSPHWQAAEHRRWLREILNPYAIQQWLSEPIRPLWVAAGSILPDWFHALEVGERGSPFVHAGEPPVLRLAYHQHHPEFPVLVRIMQTLLAAQGIRLEGVELEYPLWAAGEGKADLWLGTVNFAVPEEWHVGAWLLGSPLLRRGVGGGDAAQLSRWETQWRAGKLSSEQLAGEAIGSGWLQPLFHHWMRLKGPERAQGIHLNNLGWFDFTATWLEPDEQ